MSSQRPDDYINPTAMTHAVPKPAPSGSCRAAASGDGVGAPATVEEDAKRFEKIRSHASSHHTAGTVTPED